MRRLGTVIVIAAAVVVLHSLPDIAGYPEAREVGGTPMETVGWIAIAVVALVALVGIGFTIYEIPSIRRYLRIRSM